MTNNVLFDLLAPYCSPQSHRDSEKRKAMVESHSVSAVHIEGDGKFAAWVVVDK